MRTAGNLRLPSTRGRLASLDCVVTLAVLTAALAGCASQERRPERDSISEKGRATDHIVFHHGYRGGAASGELKLQISCTVHKGPPLVFVVAELDTKTFTTGKQTTSQAVLCDGTRHSYRARVEAQQAVDASVTATRGSADVTYDVTVTGVPPL